MMAAAHLPPLLWLLSLVALLAHVAIRAERRRVVASGDQRLNLTWLTIPAAGGSILSWRSVESGAGRAVLSWLAWLLGAMVSGPRAGTAAAAATLLAGVLMASQRHARRFRLIREGLWTFLRDLQMIASSGDGAVRCLQRAVARTGGPLADVLNPAILAIQAGIPPYEALAGIEDLRTSERYGDLLQAVWLHVETGASFVRLLEECVRRGEDAAFLRGELDAKLAEARWTARVLSLVPLAVVAYMVVFSPFALTPMLADPAGVAALAAGAVLWAVGLVVVARMQRPPADVGGEQ